MKRLILMAVVLCLATGLTTQAQVSRQRGVKRAQNSEQVVTGPRSERMAGKPQRNDKQTSVKTGDDVKKNNVDNAKNDAYRNYRIAVKKVESAQKKVDNTQRKLEKLQQDLVNERIKVAEKITSGNGLTTEVASALEKALQEVDEKYGAKIAGARTAFESAQLDLEHAKANLEAAEMEYKR